MSLIVVGKSGYIAKRLQGALSSIAPIVFTSTRPDPAALFLDLAHAGRFDYRSVAEGDVVLLAAAISSPDVCRTEHSFAYAVNVTGTSEFARRCIDCGAKVLFFSSDTVYGGVEHEVDELDACNPAGEYAVMKQEVETRFRDEPAFKALRLSYVISRTDKFTSYLAASASKGKEVEVFHPLLRRAVYIEDLIAAVSAICRRWNDVPYPRLNICGPRLVSRMDIARTFAEVVDGSLRYRQVKPGAEFYKGRPACINMGSRYLGDLLQRPSTGLAEALASEFTVK